MKKLMLAAALVFVAGCGPQPLSVWRVSAIKSGETTCTPAPKVDPNRPKVTSETKNLQADMGTWEIYEGAQTEAGEQRFYIVINGLQSAKLGKGGAAGGSTTIEGTLADGKYTFDAVVTTTTLDKAENPTATVTTKFQDAISLTDAGDSFTGEYKAVNENSCSGSGCGTNFAEANPNCEAKWELRGRSVDAVYEHAI